jgi:cyclic pyranopterin phosphate synthase
MAGPLKEAGLDRVNVSIDTLDPDKFKLMTVAAGSTWSGLG